MEYQANMVQDLREQNKNAFVDSALLYIHVNYQKGISLGSIAREIGVSPYYLSKLLHRHTSKTCTELIAEKRIEEAKKLLLRSFSSKEVCYQVGFNSQNYFAKIFKKLTGLTPDEPYRGLSRGNAHIGSFEVMPLPPITIKRQFRRNRRRARPKAHSTISQSCGGGAVKGHNPD